MKPRPMLTRNKPGPFKRALKRSKDRWQYGASEVNSGNGHPLFWPVATVSMDPFPDGGGYGVGFLPFAYKVVGIGDPHAVLHVCSGSVRIGTTVDIRSSVKPRVIADARALPFQDNTFQWVMADPPYSPEYAETLYGTGSVYPSPGVLLRELARVTRGGGRIGFLHFQVPVSPPSIKLLRVIGLMFGAGYNIRAFSVWEKSVEQLSL